MALSKKQKIIIWTMALLIVFALGLTNKTTVTPDGVDFTTKYYAYLYGITLLDGLVEPNFFYELANYGYRIMIAVVVIGAAIVITSKRKVKG